MMISRRGLLGTAAASSFLSAARADTAIIKIGMMNAAKGQSTVLPIYPSQAVAEFTGGKDLKVEILAASHESKPDVGLAIARKWFDEDGVDAIQRSHFLGGTSGRRALPREEQGGPIQ